MQRVMILGAPGSGKSTLARALGKRLDLPVFHLDRMYHRPGWMLPPADAFAADVSRVASLPAWVIDGNYASTAQPRLAAADTLILLDVPRRLRIARVLRRTLLDHGKQRIDTAEGCRERFDIAFLTFAWRWDRDDKPAVLNLVAAFDGRIEMLRSREAIRALLANPLAPTAARA